MVKVHTIEMLEHSAHSTPNVKAHADMINGALVGLGKDTDGALVTVAPSADADLYIVLNVQVGDNEYAESYDIKKGTLVNLFKVANWSGKELDVTGANLVDDFADVDVDNTLTFDATTFKFKKGAGDFTVTAKGGNLVNALRVVIK